MDLTGPNPEVTYCLLGILSRSSIMLRDDIISAVLSIFVNIQSGDIYWCVAFLYQPEWIVLVSLLNAICAVVYRQSQSWFILMHLWNSTSVRIRSMFAAQFLSYVDHNLGESNNHINSFSITLLEYEIASKLLDQNRQIHSISCGFCLFRYVIKEKSLPFRFRCILIAMEEKDVYYISSVASRIYEGFLIVISSNMGISNSIHYVSCNFYGLFGTCNKTI